MEVTLNAAQIREAVKQYVNAQTELKVKSVVVFGNFRAVAKVIPAELSEG